MGETVAAYVRVTESELPSGPETEYYNLEYDAAQVGPLYDASASKGALALYLLISGRVSRCPSLRVGVVGYSQGAHVINDGLDQLQRRNPEILKDNIKAVLQIADPKLDQKQSYTVAIDPQGNPAKEGTVFGGALERRALPAAVHGKATSLCITGDIVCNTEKKDWSTLLMALLAPFHGEYKGCCSTVSFPNLLGKGFASRMTA